MSECNVIGTYSQTVLPAFLTLSCKYKDPGAFCYLTTVQPPVATTSRQRPVFQNTKSFPVKSLYLEPLVSDHLS